MQAFKIAITTLLLPLYFYASGISAETNHQRAIQTLSDNWAEASFNLKGKAQQDRYQSTLVLADTTLADFSNDPDVLAWTGIIEASYAGTLKGMKALRHAKKARSLLSRAMEKNPEALNGGARSTLGVLYYKVPSWPIGFGNKKTAEKLLKESALSYPDNLNAQYFYAEYLMERKRKDEAVMVFEHALSIPPRPNHQLIDSARITKIEEYLADLI